LRINAQLVDAATGNHLWAERYERNMRDIFALQDEVARSVASTVSGRVEVCPKPDRIDAGIVLADVPSRTPRAASTRAVPSLLSALCPSSAPAIEASGTNDCTTGAGAGI
jgi:hypothetical protein